LFVKSLVKNNYDLKIGNSKIIKMTTEFYNKIFDPAYKKFLANRKLPMPWGEEWITRNSEGEYKNLTENKTDTFFKDNANRQNEGGYILYIKT